MKKTVAAALLTASCATGAWAQFYAGAALGPSRVDLDCQGTTRCHHDDSGFKLFGGLQMSTNLSLEASYMDFGTASYQYTNGGVTDGHLDVSGVTFAGVWRMDFIPEFAGMLRLGIAYVETKVKEQGATSASASSYATKPYWGLGAQYTFSKHVKGVAAADFTTGKFRGTNGFVHLYTLGAQVDF